MFGGAHMPVRIESNCKYVVAEKVMLQFVAELTAGKNERCLGGMRFCKWVLDWRGRGF